ncbi:unnamed protein product [Ectocarpus sp. CCAP 1310/34]|nr:unnamed protein product [Ectocarpus sp. CCAP 1310/34]
MCSQPWTSEQPACGGHLKVGQNWVVLCHVGKRGASLGLTSVSLDRYVLHWLSLDTYSEGDGMRGIVGV